MKHFSLLLFTLFIPFISLCQGYVPNTTTFGHLNYVEYYSGTLPIILSAPHGGDMAPGSIPDRACGACVTVNDAYTQELTRELDSLLFERTGCHPHFIINRLRRIKLDANREIVEAAQGNVDAEAAWDDYHDFIESAKDSIINHYGAGLFLDMHGHGHTIQRLELGYLVSASNLRKTDSTLNAGTYGDSSSIRNLISTNLSGWSFAELLRGPEAFGTICENDSIHAVPSAQDSFPLVGESYFSGGYNTRRHGSKNGGTIDAIQIECNQDVRFNASDRLVFADSLASVILDFLRSHYFPDSVLGICNDPLLMNAESISNQITIFPNPSTGKIDIQMNERESGMQQIFLYDPTGKRIFHQSFDQPIHHYREESFQGSPGVYFMHISLSNGKTLRYKFIKL